MKIQKLSLLAATALASLVATTSIAQTNTNLVAARIKVTCVTTNASGQLVYTRNNSAEFIQDFASSLGIVTNTTNFSLVLNFTNSSLQVVNGTNQTLVGTVLSFTNGVFLINSNHTVVELQSMSGRGAQSTTTESDGRFYFPEIVPGNYRLFARRDGHWPAEFGQRWVDGPGQVLTIAPGAKLRDVQVVMTPGGVIAGRITNDNFQRALGQRLPARRFEKAKRQSDNQQRETVSIASQVFQGSRIEFSERHRQRTRRAPGERLPRGRPACAAGYCRNTIPRPAGSAARLS